MTGQLDKAKEVAALSATVTVKEIHAGVDVERRAGFGMQGTESDELGAVSDRPSGPTMLPQIIEQPEALFQFFDVLAHDAVLPLEASVEDCCQHSQARMVGGEIFSEPQGPENLQSRNQPRQRSSLVIGRITKRQPLSHAGERLAETIGDGKRSDIWVYEWGRDALTRRTFTGEANKSPVWTPDGQGITYVTQEKGGAYNLYWKRADGAGDAQRLSENKNDQKSLRRN